MGRWVNSLPCQKRLADRTFMPPTMQAPAQSTLLVHPIAPDSPKLRGFRQRLVDLLARKGIRDQRVLDAIQQVPRHFFIESALAEKAYEDIPLPIGHDQTISQPYTVAFMTAQLHLPAGAKVLEIGTGSGYQCAILMALGYEVYSIERHRPLTLHAKHVLDHLGMQPLLKVGDGTLGWPTYAPFDGIIVTAGGPSVPEALREQLAIGGKLVIPVGDREGQRLTIVSRTGPDAWHSHQLDGFRFVPLVGEQGW